ncbi:glutamate receptor ionotropic, delta-1 [Caerostris extrusa]|uniref:Glutamate receptor ionotropic, delta-1 n=1 Tax=Caerostris extrusa TaxID=172846 RepID=A0AAV4XD60_CAEEX|nr:glutamate receptor ionotropic, delta-1 [Caerostris extrusa]
MKFPSTIDVAVLTSEHMFEMCEQNNSDVKLSGVEGRFLDIIASALKFKYQVKTPVHRDWGHLDADGHWTGLVGMVHRKEADIALSTLTMSDDRMTVVDFTTPYTIQDVTFLLEKPETLFSNDIFQPFDFNSWMCILLLSEAVKRGSYKCLVEKGSTMPKSLSMDNVST